jgi:DNA-directed RNA polymerase specialized sigma24 family protein
MYKNLKDILCPRTDRRTQRLVGINNEDQLSTLALRGGGSPLHLPSNKTVADTQSLLSCLEARDDVDLLFTKASPRVQELLKLLATRMTRSDAATHMGISRSTVDNMIYRLRRRSALGS